VPESAAATNSTTTPESEFVALPDPSEKPIPGVKVEKKSGDTMSINLNNVPLDQVVEVFTKISNANIVALPSSLSNCVTVNLKDVEWKPALMSILDMHQLALVEKTPGSGVFSIVPKAAQEPLIVETMFLRYASVSNIEAVVKSMAPAPGSVATFASRNALIIRATDAQLREIKTMMKTVDTMREQVFIEAKFMELTDEAIKDLGINWQILQGYSVSATSLGMNYKETRAWDQSKSDKISQWDSRRNTDISMKGYNNAGVEQADSTITATPASSGSSTHGTPGTMTYTTAGTPARQISDSIDKGKELSQDIANSFTKNVSDVRTAVLAADDFKVMLSALKQMNGVSVVSNPKLIVANEEPATIHIGQRRRPFTSNVTAGQNGIAPVVTYNPGEPVLTGVKLVVTPTINTESNITVKIEPELTRIVSDETAPNGQTYPIVATKTIKTVFCLESGKTVAIGGLTETDDRDNTKKIPLLGDIPLIGKYLFSWTHQQKSQTETIIFVTVGLAKPENVQADAGLPEDTELAQRKMIEQKVKKQKHRSEMEKLNAEADAKLNAGSEKAKSRLMKMSK